ncbi:MAG: glycyl-radical enzyme activating protein [Candidatus Lokiarchaeota archaeon]|nr:glycyl-radical enzyme activating protein [Candidatus Lokiarchaeota archaeon]MBD3339282.1 glycyl-radical enzyme activating protein [Candidatus Lokiarchaeota archaeon]
MDPLIVDIKRNALDDGPGIRTLVFFKGCPLSCVWCQNPETKSTFQEISYEREKCIQCSRCVETCELDAINFSLEYPLIKKKCNLCGNCVEGCQSHALKLVGKYYKTDELIKIILKDKVFYENSGGGVTFSGGEPTLHMEYLHELLTQLRKYQIHSCIETCGYYNREKFNNFILPYIDLIYFDLKLFDLKSHQKYCKAPNKRILNNFEDLVKNQKINLLPRIPLIPGVTSTKANLDNLAKYLKSLGIQKIGLLPYNPLWISKSEKIGVEKTYFREEWLNDGEKERIKEIFSEFKFKDF